MGRLRARGPEGAVIAPAVVPYQGSKRAVAATLVRCLPRDTEALVEPFAGSAAVTLAAAAERRARRFLIGDQLAPLAQLWEQVVADPEPLVRAYAQHWAAQASDPAGYYLQTRDAFNRAPDAATLLFLLARCVKSAVRFNRAGAFNQAADRRRLGARPALVAARLRGAHVLLRSRTQVHSGDYGACLAAAGPGDVVYLDPPYVGVSDTPDRRYVAGLDYDRFVRALEDGAARGLSVLVSFDGRCGERVYGPGLPASLGFARREVAMGRSSQATLLGRSEQTVESLYASPALVARLAADGVDFHHLDLGAPR